MDEDNKNFFLSKKQNNFTYYNKKPGPTETKTDQTPQPQTEYDILSSAADQKTMFNYFIQKTGSTYQALNTSGEIVSSNAAFHTLLNAVIALCTSPAKIYIEDGSYTVTGSIVDGGSDDVELHLARNAVLTLGANADTHMFYLTDCSGWWIHGGTIDGNDANQTTPGGAANTNSYGIYLMRTTNTRINDMVIHDFCRSGIKTEGSGGTYCTDTLIENCYIYDCNWSGILPDTYTQGIIIRSCRFTGGGEGGVGGGTVAPIIDVLIEGCTQHDINGALAPVGYNAGIYMEAGTNIKIINNHVWNCKVGIFITADGDDTNIIANNTIHDCSGNSECPGILCKSYRTIIANNQVNHAVAYKPGILAGSGSDGFGNEDIIIGNIIHGSTNSHGIQVVRSNNVTVANNNIIGCTGKGIMLMTNSSYCNIQGNRVTSGSLGIHIDNANCIRNFIAGNNFDGCTDAMTDTGTNTRYGYNLNQAGTVVEGSMP